MLSIACFFGHLGAVEQAEDTTASYYYLWWRVSKPHQVAVWLKTAACCVWKQRWWKRCNWAQNCTWFIGWSLSVGPSLQVTPLTVQTATWAVVNRNISISCNFRSRNFNKDTNTASNRCECADTWSLRESEMRVFENMFPQEIHVTVEVGGFFTNVED